MTDTAATTTAGGSTAVVSTGITASALEALEQQYINTLKELTGEPELTEFKAEYEKLHRLLLKSVEGEKRLRQRNEALVEELTQHRGKINTAMDLSEEDEKTILNLRKEIEKAWALADSAHAREKESKELVTVLKKQITELDKNIEKSAGLSVGQETYLYDLIQLKKEKEEEHAVLSGKRSGLAMEHHDMSIKVQRTLAEENAVRQHLEELLTSYQNLLNDMEEQHKERQAKEESVREYREAAEKAALEMGHINQRIDALAQEKKQLTKQTEALADELLTMDRLITAKQEKFKSEADHMSDAERQNIQLKKEIPKKEAFLREKERQLAKVNKQKEKVEGEARQQQEKLKQLVQQREEGIQQQEAMNEEVGQLLERLQQTEREYIAVELELKAEMAKKNKSLAEKSSKENETTAVENQKIAEGGRKRRLAQELESKRVENETYRKTVFQLEQQHAKEMGGAQKTVLQHHKVLDLIREKKSRQEVLHRTLEEHEKRRKVQQELVDRVRVSRNRAEAQWEACAEELQQLRQRAESKKEEINDLKNELISKEGELYQQYTLANALDRDIKAAEQRVQHLEEDCAHANTRVSALEKEVAQLNQVIKKCEEEKAAQEGRLRAIRGERNTLAGQLLRKEEELRLLYDKIQLQKATLRKGELDYKNRVKDVMDMRDQLIEVRLRCRLALIKARMIESLKRREAHSQRLLWKERVTAKGLSEELQNSVNVHRWRELEGSSPEVMDLIERINLVQKRMIAKNDELEKKKADVAAKEKEYQSLRQQLARLPGPEAAEELALFEENLTKREEQIAMMHQELENVEMQAELLADEVAQLNHELAEVKQDYFEAKTKHDLLLREQKLTQKTFGLVDPLNISGSGSTGGGGGRRRSVSQPAPSQTRLSAGCSYKARKEKKKKEEELLEVLASGATASSFPLRKPPGQRQFVGGGFALNKQ